MKDINKLKIGDYVRCGSAGIRKVTQIIKDNKTSKVIEFIDDKNITVDIKYVQDFSSNPLDLVKEGDCINRNIVSGEYFDNGILYRDSNNYKHRDKLVRVKKNEIDSFITKEQLDKDEYIFNWN